MFTFIKDYKRRQRRKLIVLSGFSALLGGVLALLFSPRSGEENRKFVSKKGKEVLETVKDSSNKMPDYVKQSVDNLQREFNNLKNRLVEEISQRTKGSENSEEKVIDIREEEEHPKKKKS